MNIMQTADDSCASYYKQRLAEVKDGIATLRAELDRHPGMADKYISRYLGQPMFAVAMAVEKNKYSTNAPSAPVAAMSKLDAEIARVKSFCANGGRRD